MFSEEWKQGMERVLKTINKGPKECSIAIMFLETCNEFLQFTNYKWTMPNQNKKAPVSRSLQLCMTRSGELASRIQSLFTKAISGKSNAYCSYIESVYNKGCFFTVLDGKQTLILFLHIAPHLLEYYSVVETQGGASNSNHSAIILTRDYVFLNFPCIFLCPDYIVSKNLSEKLKRFCKQKLAILEKIQM